MAKTKLEDLGYTLKEDGRIDFTKPPKGKVFVPIPVDEHYLELADVDSRFLTNYKFSATWKKVQMHLVDEKDAEIVREYIESYKAENKRRERSLRCKICSPITGKRITCPETNRCHSEDCPMKRGEPIDRESQVDINKAEELIPELENLEDEVVEKLTWKGFKETLPPELMKFAQMKEEACDREEILIRFNKRTDQTSWFYNKQKRLRDLWEEYNKTHSSDRNR